MIQSQSCNGLGVLPGGIKCPGCDDCMREEKLRPRKHSNKTPTQRTLEAMRGLGRTYDVAEKFNLHVGEHGIRQDLFGFIDIVAIDPVEGIIAIQSCGQGFSDHVKKLTIERKGVVSLWLKHAKVELWGWRKVKNKLKNGGYGKSTRWKARVADFTLDGKGKITVKERK